MAKLIYESEEVDENDNPTGYPSDWDYSLICNKCGAYFICDCLDQAQSTINQNNYCYNCGAKLRKYELKK